MPDAQSLVENPPVPRPIALLTLAGEHLQAGQLAPAVELLREAIGLRPDWAPAHFVLAEALQRQGNSRGALASYGRVLELKPHCAAAHANSAAIWATLEEFDLAKEHYERAIVLAPEDFAALNNLGAVYHALGQIAESAACYERALRLKPDCVEPLLNLAGLRMKRREYAAGAALLEQAARLAPDVCDVQNRLGQGYVALGDTVAAQRHFAAALVRQPDRLAWRLRLDSLCPPAAESDDEIDAYQRRLAERLAGYEDRRWNMPIDELPAADCKPPVELLYHGREDLAIRRRFAEIVGRSLPQFDPPRGHGQPAIGFYVPQGSEGIFLRGMGGVLTRLTSDRFRVIVLCAPGGIEKLRGGLGDAIRLLPLAGSFSRVIETARAAALDLIYYWEVGSDAASYLLPFFRPAAVQCTSWGWPTTSGIPQMDFFLSSESLEAPEADDHYSEKLVRLRHIPNYYPRPTEPSPAADRARFGFDPAATLYVCPQNPRKIQPDFDDLAGVILRRDPRGLLAIVDSRSPNLSAAIARRIAGRFPDCASRVRIVPRMTRGEYLTLLATADVLLDTVGYAGGANSAYDAFHVGTPVVTLPTLLHRGRYTAAAYRAMGLSRCIAANAEQYVETAVRLAGDRTERQAASHEITATHDALFDNLAAVRELEDFFERAIAAARG